MNGMVNQIDFMCPTKIPSFAFESEKIERVRKRLLLFFTHSFCESTICYFLLNGPWNTKNNMELGIGVESMRMLCVGLFYYVCGRKCVSQQPAASASSDDNKKKIVG